MRTKPDSSVTFADDCQLLTMKTGLVLIILFGIVGSQSPGEDGASGIPSDHDHASQQAPSYCVDHAATPQQQIIINPPSCETSAAADARCRNCCTVAEEIAKLRDGQDELKRKLDDVLVLFRGALNNSSALVLPRDCSDPLLNEAESGVYRIQPLDQGPSIEVYCDMDTIAGGWTVFQRRQDGSVDFFLYWEDYRLGFGDLNGEFWLGNDNLHRITSQGEYELRIDMTDFEDNSAYAAYDTFSISGSSERYLLTVTGYSGTAGDSLSNHNNQPFSTRDRENGSENCAQKYHGAWWYATCHHSNLNGNYLGGDTDLYAQGVVWRAWKEYYYSLKTSEMKMRRKN